MLLIYPFLFHICFSFVLKCIHFRCVGGCHIEAEIEVSNLRHRRYKWATCTQYLYLCITRVSCKDGTVTQKGNLGDMAVDGDAVPVVVPKPRPRALVSEADAIGAHIPALGQTQSKFQDVLESFSSRKSTLPRAASSATTSSACSR